VPQLLELTQFSQSDHVSHVNVRGTGVEAFLQPQFFAAVQQLGKFLFEIISETPVLTGIQICTHITLCLVYLESRRRVSHLRRSVFQFLDIIEVFFLRAAV